MLEWTTSSRADYCKLVVDKVLPYLHNYFTDSGVAMENLITLLAMMFHLRYKVQDDVQGPLPHNVQVACVVGSSYSTSRYWLVVRKKFIIHCQMLLSEDLHIALTSATNQPRENTETWLNSLESLPELDPDSERMLQFNQVYNRFASTLSEDSIFLRSTSRKPHLPFLRKPPRRIRS